MALQGPIPIEFEMVFPHGVYAAGGIEMAVSYTHLTLPTILRV